ncbi:MAG: replication-relaxation family protein [Actinomycetota bacterium]
MSRRRELPEGAGALDERDVAILVALVEHKLLTTEHIHTLFFNSARRAQTKVQELRELAFINTLNARARGRRPDRHHLTELGAQVATFHLGRARSELRVPTTEAEARVRLPHRLGVNDFFCRLVLVCDASGCGVQAWEDEHKVRAGGREVQPDGFGRLLHPGGAVEFLLEYDRGTEHFWAVVRKLGNYLAVSSARPADSPEQFPNVLFVVPGRGREELLRRAFAVAVERWDPSTARSARMPFYVSHRRALGESGHLGPVWLPLAAPARWLRITELEGTPECFWDLSECLRVRWIQGAWEG